MVSRFAQLPSALRRLARTQTLAGVPALLAHPDWETPAPTVLWMHGRTAHKELDPGRYLRLVRAGIAVCAMDLPGHGARADQAMQRADATPGVVRQMAGEIDGVVQALLGTAYKGAFDPVKLGVGGISAGGMAALVRVCDAHPFVCCAVEASTGDLGAVFQRREVDHACVASCNPMQRLGGWRPIPTLAMHSEADEWVPFRSQRGFLEKLRARCDQEGADPAMVELVSWPTTGAPYEHVGFGRVAARAKDAQTTFFTRCFFGDA